eukprot:1668037-Amphidinium_carterae.2
MTEENVQRCFTRLFGNLYIAQCRLLVNTLKWQLAKFYQLAGTPTLVEQPQSHGSHRTWWRPHNKKVSHEERMNGVDTTSLLGD